MILFVGGWFTYLNFQKETAYGAIAGDYQTIASGNWEDFNIWQKFDGTSWISATSTPNKNDGTITIQSGHTVVVRIDIDVDQTVINTGGMVDVSPGKRFRIRDGIGADLVVSGILRNAGDVQTDGTVSFMNGGKYQHNFSASNGDIPNSTWLDGSVCEIIGYTTNSSAPNNLNQTFSNFVWNCPSQTINIKYIKLKWAFNVSN